MIEFICQSDSELLIIKLDRLVDSPVMDSHHLQNERVDVPGWYANVLLAHFVAIYLQQVRKKRLSNGYMKAVSIHYARIWNAMPCPNGLPQLLPHHAVIFFSHVVFLIWVGGVATTTLAGFGVAFYFGGAV